MPNTARARTATSPGVGRTKTSITARRTTVTSVRAVTSRPMPATRPNTVRCAVTSRSVCPRTITAATLPHRTTSVRTAPSFSGRASRSAARSHSSTSTATRRRHTGVRSPVRTPVTAAGSSWAIPRSSGTASRRRLRRKRRARRSSSVPEASPAGRRRRVVRSLRWHQRCRCLRRLPGPRRRGQPAC